MTVTPHDFTRPLPLARDLRARLTQWLVRANIRSAEQFAGMSVPIEFQVESCLTAFPSEALSQWSDKSAAYNVSLNGSEAPSIVALPNPLMQEIVSRMLGEQPSRQAEERELSPAETSVGEFFVQTLIQNLNESWLEESCANVKVEQIEPNLRRTRHFRPIEPFVECRTLVKTPLGASHWSWFLSNDFLAGVFGLPTRPRRSPTDQSSRRQLESLVRVMQAEIVVRLGTVQLSGPQLSALRTGDVVVLDQRVSEPLRATIQGQPKFLGWAGRVGDRQAFEIDSEIQHKRPGVPGLEPAATVPAGTRSQ